MKKGTLVGVQLLFLVLVFLAITFIWGYLRDGDLLGVWRVIAAG